MESIQNKQCVTCKLAAANISLKFQNLCKECFLSKCYSKLKKSIRTRLFIWKYDLCLIGVSGSSNSLALVHLLSNAMKESHFGLWFMKYSVIHIDLSEITEKSFSNAIIDNCKKIGISCYIVPLSFAFENEPFEINAKNQKKEITKPKRKTKEEKKKNEFPKEKPKVELEKEPEIKIYESSSLSKERLLKLFKSNPDINYFLQEILIKRLLLSICRSLKFSRILLGTSGDSISYKSFRIIREGRGINLPFECQLIDDRYNNEIVMRPLTDFSNKELACYNIFNKINFHNFSKSLGSRNYDSNLIEFIDKNDQGPAKVVQNIVSTCQNLIQPTNINICGICLGLVDLPNIKIEEGKIQNYNYNYCYGCNFLLNVHKNRTNELLELMPMIKFI